MNDKYYAVHQVCGPIYGVGLSPDEAIADANQYLDEPISADDLVDRRAANDGDLLLTECSRALFEYVRDYGGDVTYDGDIGSVMIMPDEP